MKKVLHLAISSLFTLGMLAQNPDDYVQISKFNGEYPSVSANYGWSVAMDGDYLVVGEKDGDSNASTDVGIVFVYKKQGEFYTLVDELVASDGAAFDDFGVSVDIDGDWIIVGANFDDDVSFSSGSAYIFKKDAGLDTWTEVDKLNASDIAGSDQFGIVVRISSSGWAVVGSGDNPTGNGSSFSGQGAAYVFQKDNNLDTWTQHTKLTSPNALSGHLFSTSNHGLDIEDDYIIVGEQHSDLNALNESGAAYLFQYNVGLDSWDLAQTIEPSDPGVSEEFGYAVSMDQDYAVITAWEKTTPNGSSSGGAYVFKRDGFGQYQEVEVIDPRVGSLAGSFDDFGNSVSIKGDYIAIGSVFADGSGIFSSGAAYIYQKDSVLDDWTELIELEPADVAGSDNFGRSVAINENGVLVVGSNGDDDNGFSSSGSAYIYEVAGPKPEISNFMANNITATGFDLNVDVDDMDRGTDVTIRTGSTSGGNDIKETQFNLPLGSGITPFADNVTGLDYSSTYYSTVEATSLAGTTMTTELEIVTSPIAPEITGFSVDNVTTTTVDFSADVDDKGTSTTFYVEIGLTSGSYTLRTPINVQAGDRDFDNAPVSITGLTPLTQYFLRGVVINSEGTMTTNEFIFWTIEEPSGKEPAISRDSFKKPDELTIRFDPPTTAGADGYLIVETPNLVIPGLAPAGVGVPTDFVVYNEGDFVGNSKIIEITTDVNQADLFITGLQTDLLYVFTIFPFNWDGVNANSRNFETANIPASIQAQTPPAFSIFSETADIIGCYNEANRSLGVAVSTESGTLSYQWMKDGEDVEMTEIFPMANDEQALFFNTLRFEHSGIYSVDIWPAAYTRDMAIRSRDYTVFVHQNPTFSVQPKPVTAEIGGVAEMSFEATINGNNIFENPPYEVNVDWWTYDEANNRNVMIEDNDIISGTKSSLIKVNGVTQELIDLPIWVEVSGYCGMISSNTVTINKPPMVTIGGLTDLSASSGTICGGTEVTLEASATVSNGMNENLTYQWFDMGVELMDGAGVAGASTSSLTVTVQDGVNHMITYKVNYTGPEQANEVESTTLNAYGRIPASINTQPMDITVEEGQSASFTVDAMGDDITYNWYSASSTMSLGTESTLILDNLLEANSGDYFVVVSNACGDVTSDNALLTVTTSGNPTSVDEQAINLMVSPNPFNSVATISFNVEEISNVRVTLIDAVGNTIATLLNNRVSGTQQVRIDANELSLSQGTYFYTINIDGKSTIKQVVYVK